MARVPRVSLGRRPPRHPLGAGGLCRSAGPRGAPWSVPWPPRKPASGTATWPRPRASTAPPCPRGGGSWRALATPDSVAILERLAEKDPKDPELAFALAGGYLGLKKVDRAAALFAEIARERPIPQTHVLIGRTWSDHGEFARARTELRAALKQDARVRRAHYYLGLAALAEARRLGVDEAIEEFKAEVAIAPEDPLANLELGVALVQRQLFAEAMPALEVASRAEPPQARAFAYLGRAQLGLDRPGDAAASLGRALALATAQGANRPALLAIHLHLGQALQRLGRREEAAAHFAESQRLSAAGHGRRARAARPLPGAMTDRPAGRERPRRRRSASRCSGA